MSSTAQPAYLPSPAMAFVPALEARLHTQADTVIPLWCALEASGTSTAYQRQDWIGGLLAHLAGPGVTALFVEVWERAGGRPVMIVPLALHRRGILRIVTWLDLGVCDYAAPILPAGRDLTQAETVEAWAAVRAVLPPADIIHLSRIPAEIHGRPNPIAALPGCRRMAEQASGVAIDGDPETLLSRLCRPSTLKDLGKQRRRLERAGATRFSAAQTPEEVEALFSALVAQRRDRFRALGRFDLLARPEIETFYREAALAGLRGGPARILGLSVDGACVATAYGLVHRERFHGIILTASGDERWRNASPGVQIVGECLRWARAQGLDYFDFTVGDLPYKKDFGVVPRDLDEILQPLTPQGWMFAAGRSLAGAGLRRLRRHPSVYRRVQTLRRKLRKIGTEARAERA